MIRRAVLTLAVITLAGCAGKHAATQLNPDILFGNALSALQRHHWADAAILFERFTLQYPSNARLPEARFHLGEAYFGKQEYVTAANEFSRLADDYPAGNYADDARFKICESYYRLSPKPELDQQYTRSALDHCASLLAYYASSEFAPKAQAFLTELKTRLAEKAFLTAEFYLKRNAFDSAIIYYEAALRDYPDTPTAPRTLLRLYETYHRLNYKDEMDAAKQRLLKDYPTSPEAKQLQQPTAPAGS